MTLDTSSSPPGATTPLSVKRSRALSESPPTHEGGPNQPKKRVEQVDRYQHRAEIPSPPTNPDPLSPSPSIAPVGPDNTMPEQTPSATANQASKLYQQPHNILTPRSLDPTSSPPTKSVSSPASQSPATTDCASPASQSPVATEYSSSTLEALAMAGFVPVKTWQTQIPSRAEMMRMSSAELDAICVKLGLDSWSEHPPMLPGYPDWDYEMED